MVGCSGVARGGGARGQSPPPEFVRSVNPIQTKGGRLSPSHYYQAPQIQKVIYTSDLVGCIVEEGLTARPVLGMKYLSNYR